MTKVMSRKQRVTLICFALKVNSGDVFSVDGNLNQLWRITEENGLECFESDWLIGRPDSGHWDFPREGILTISSLLTNWYTITVFPKSPLRDLKFREPYTGGHFWGDANPHEKIMRRNMKLACLMLGIQTGDVFCIDEKSNNFWRITPENGLEKFQGCYGWTGDEHLVGGRWSYPVAGDIDLGMLLLGDYTIKVYPNSPLKGMKFCKTYAVLDLLGNGGGSDAR